MAWIPCCDMREENKGIFSEPLELIFIKTFICLPLYWRSSENFFFCIAVHLLWLILVAFCTTISPWKRSILHAVQTYIIYEEQIIALEKAKCGRGRQKEELVMITYNRANQCTPYRSDVRKYHNSMFSFLSPMAKYVWPNKSVIFLSYTSREHRTFSYT